MKRKLNEDWAETDTIVVVLAEKEYKTPNWGLSIPEHCALCDVRLGGFLWWPRDEVHLVCLDCYNRWATEQDDHFSYSTLAPNRYAKAEVRKPTPPPVAGADWNRGSMCELTHLCAVCGAVALHPNHGTRGKNWKVTGSSNCAEGNFMVRCQQCRDQNKKKDGQVYAIELDWNVSEEEIKKREQTPIVYEIM